MFNLFYENEYVFNVLFEAVTEGVVVVDENQTIVITNSATEKMFGYEKDKLRNQPLSILIPVNYHKKHNSYFDKYYKNSSQRKMGQSSDLLGTHKNGKMIPVEIGLNPFEFGTKKYVMAMVVDITIRKDAELKIKKLNTELEQKIDLRTQELNKTVNHLKEEIVKRNKAEKKLKKALKKEKDLNELKTKFLSLVSHEFKTPLSGILNAAILVGKYAKTEMQPNREKHLGTIKNKVEYLNRILSEFLSMERLESGKENYKLNHFKLSKVVNEVIYNANLLLKVGQRIIYPTNIDEIDLYHDEKIIELIMSNLLHNAIKYSKENSTIEIEIKLKNNWLILQIKDEGIGIPVEEQNHIFERYFRAENVLTLQGTGIGLNIVKGHVDKFGGDISFKSAKNLGTTFTVKLPLIKE
ncbi:PAS domain-containing sensor histidine kinase [Lutibacter sp.]|uniref:PAS domain-containing sensor histidine kinase n=1 Tax=Lutibacter sp. TaxID=1925666 RepID=UPI0025C586CA|nr:PAS domain-containing sensor histidine kinase [Lutibacter sp.]MCF6181565.1 PAS domain-containing sensor histidine kinase [Lutibacter sp.]